MNYCQDCGGRITVAVPEGDDRRRHVCERCKTVFYQNPKVVAGAIPEWKGKILFCRRAIEPARGLWTLPAGYLENGETVAECAARETWEEAGAKIHDPVPYALINLPHIHQVYFMYRAQLQEPRYMAGTESLEVRLFAPDDIPWDEIAFTSIRKTLELYCSDLRNKAFSGMLHEVVL